MSGIVVFWVSWLKIRDGLVFIKFGEAAVAYEIGTVYIVLFDGKPVLMLNRR